MCYNVCNQESDLGSGPEGGFMGQEFEPKEELPDSGGVSTLSLTRCDTTLPYICAVKPLMELYVKPGRYRCTTMVLGYIESNFIL